MFDLADWYTEQSQRFMQFGMIEDGDSDDESNDTEQTFDEWVEDIPY